MVKKPLYYRPQIFYLLVLITQFIVLLILLIPFEPTVFLLFLLILFSLFLRWRININPSYMLIDQFLFLIIAYFYPVALLYCFIFVFYLAYNKKLIYTIPILISGLFADNIIIFYGLCLQAAIFGMILYYWEYDCRTNTEANDRLRRNIYELEITQTDLLKDYKDAEKIAILSERQRIAEIIHDDLGHELTAAHLALKAYDALLKQDNKELAEITLNKAKLRLDNALNRLKDSVKNIEPPSDYGLFQINNYCENFVYPVNFTHSGDVSKINPYIWQLIYASFKEALTNIIKHSRPTKININFEVTDYIVRLIIENDGAFKKEKTNGHGLRYMRNRIEAINGSLIIDNNVLFKLIITIPIGGR